MSRMRVLPTQVYLHNHMRVSHDPYAWRHTCIRTLYFNYTTKVNYFIMCSCKITVVGSQEHSRAGRYNGVVVTVSVVWQLKTLEGALT